MGRVSRPARAGLLLVLVVILLAFAVPVDVPLVGPTLGWFAGILGRILFWGLIALVLVALVLWIFPTPSRR